MKDTDVGLYDASMNLINNKYDVLVTGHNLDDEAAVLFSNTLGWDLDLLQRQSPVLPAKMGLTRKTKPFCRFYEKESATSWVSIRGWSRRLCVDLCKL